MRIIGGRLRGRRLAVPAGTGLRPTPDRVRETLFNWLQPVIAGSRCLDLFAGSGALGLEALSRGAAEVVMVERSKAVVRVLRARIEDWGLGGIVIEEADALEWLRKPPQPFHIAFADPPYADGLLEPTLARLARGWLPAGGCVYMEAPAHEGLPALPPGWHLARQGQAGGVRFALAEAELPGESLLS